MLFKIVIATLLLFMVYNLFQALLLMNKGPMDKELTNKESDQPSMTKYIGRRLMVSVAIVVLLLIGILTGFITPNPRPY